jgi:hypothetical protein
MVPLQVGWFGAHIFVWHVLLDELQYWLGEQVVWTQEESPSALQRWTFPS